MLKNYFVTAFNNLLKHRLYSVINIVGLAIGLAACILIALYVREETSYDNWDDAERIYRLNFTFFIPGREPIKFAYAPVPAVPALLQNFPEEIDYAARNLSASRTVEIGDKNYEEFLAQVDPDFIHIFQFEVLAGSLEDTLSDFSNIALSEEVATRFFGAGEPIGKVITVTDQGVSTDRRVTAVYRIPGNTVVRAPMMALLNDTVLPRPYQTWFSGATSSYLKLKPGADAAFMESRTAEMLDRIADISQLFPDPSMSPSEVLQMGFQNIRSAHLESPFDSSRAGGNKTVVLSFAAISILVLLIGCINFTILTTAKATQRSREVAMRKVVGAKRKQLILQFLGESYFIVALAMFLGLGLVELGLPVFESMVGKYLAIDYSAPSSWFVLLALLGTVGLCGGLYPAFVMSGFLPGGILRANQSTETRGSMSLRNLLVVFQFAVSIILIIASGVIYAQLLFSMNRDPGYNKDNLLVINQLNGREELAGKLDPLKQELLAQPGISNVALSEFQPSQQSQNFFVYTKAGEQGGTSYSIARDVVGYDYFSTYQIPLVAGRDYDRDRDIPMPRFDFNTLQVGQKGQELIDRNIIINVSAASQLGFVNPEDAVGRIINTETVGNINYTIIGVVADNHIFSINARPRAETYILDPAFERISAMTIRFRGSPERALEQVDAAWRNVMGDAELSTVFVDQLVADEYRQEQLEVRIILSFSMLAIIIACLGLYGSAAFTVDRRVKEIGLRKVMGARVKDIVRLLIWQFSKPVLIANVIAWPIAITIMLRWLQRFPYQIEHWYLAPLCALAAVIALAIAWITVAGNTIRVARANPILALRYE